MHFFNSELGRKVSKKRNLDDYDNQRPATVQQSASFGYTEDGFSQEFVRDYPSTHTRDKALLVALGVDGDVPFFKAAENAGLPVVGCERGVLFANRGQWVAANDNFEHAMAA